MRVNRGERANRMAVIFMVAAGGSAAMSPAVQSQSSTPQPVPQIATGAAPAVPTPAAPAQKTGDWPKLMKPSQDKPAPQTAWSEAEIKVAQQRCLEILKGLDIVAVGAAPVRENDECGAPAPIELISVGKNPEVTLSPTVTVTCDMAASMHQWVSRDLQPLARKYLGAPIIRIETMSSYSCRNAYGRTKSRLSEHGRANAIDIRSFTTAKAATTEVLADWGPTVRDIQAKIAAAKAEAARIETAKAEAAAKAAAASKLAKGGSGPAVPDANGVNPIAAGSNPGGPAAALSGGGMPAPSTGSPIPGISVQPQSGGGLGIGLSLPAPSRLGGPKVPQAAAATEKAIITETPASRMVFLKQAHEAACKVFGTVLGPEANNAHRNHFHVDMAPRARGSFCE